MTTKGVLSYRYLALKAVADLAQSLLFLLKSSHVLFELVHASLLALNGPLFWRAVVNPNSAAIQKLRASQLSVLQQHQNAHTQLRGRSSSPRRSINSISPPVSPFSGNSAPGSGVGVGVGVGGALPFLAQIPNHGSHSRGHSREPKHRNTSPHRHGLSTSYSMSNVRNGPPPLARHASASLISPARSPHAPTVVLNRPQPGSLPPRSQIKIEGDDSDLLPDIPNVDELNHVNFVVDASGNVNRPPTINGRAGGSNNGSYGRSSARPNAAHAMRGSGGLAGIDFLHDTPPLGASIAKSTPPSLPRTPLGRSVRTASSDLLPNFSPFPTNDLQTKGSADFGGEDWLALELGSHTR